MSEFSHLIEADKYYRKKCWDSYNFTCNGIAPYKYRKLDGEQLEFAVWADEQVATSIYNNYMQRFPKEMKEASRINHANFARVRRLSSRISSMLENDMCEKIFLTLTFRNEVLENTTEMTRRKYVTNFLKANCFSYVANIDYGAENEREHYHAVVLASHPIDCHDWHFGAINFERIKKPNERAMAKYVSKLTNHAIKVTNKRSVIIYSK